MSAETKTKELKRLDVAIDLLVENERNPNKMSKRAFDLLVDNIQKTGLTDAILVRPLKGGKYRIVGGHHRYKAAYFLGMETVPVTVMGDDFDEDQENFQLVRMNMIRGKLDIQAMQGLMEALNGKYADDILQDAFGFSEDAEWQKIVNQTAKMLPDKATQDKFKEAAKEIKTIDGLSKLLNQMFTKYGDTLPYGFMVFDHGGQRSIWLQVSTKTIDTFNVIGELCIENEVSVDDLVGGVLQLIAKGELKEQVAKVIAKAPKIDIPKALQTIPTKENLAKLEAVT